jgi:hypothetical protein
MVVRAREPIKAPSDLLRVLWMGADGKLVRELLPASVLERAAPINAARYARKGAGWLIEAIWGPLETVHTIKRWLDNTYPGSAEVGVEKSLLRAVRKGLDLPMTHEHACEVLVDALGLSRQRLKESIHGS